MNYIENLIDLAITEDLGSGDITTDALINGDIKTFAKIVAKESFIVAGLDIAKKVFEKFDKESEFKFNFKDGDKISKSDVLMTINGKTAALLKAERIALNFLQRLSGIATKTMEYVLEIKGFNVRLVDTRKTTPGFRILEKYAVRVGNGFNHRMGLYDGILIKDNHIAVMNGVKNAVKKIKNRVSHLIKIEVEVSNFKEIEDALEADVDVIMLDNMNLKDVKKAVKIINKKAIVEVSGDVTKKDLKALAQAGVDIISSGSITHQATAVDISMRIETFE